MRLFASSLRCLALTILLGAGANASAQSLSSSPPGVAADIPQLLQLADYLGVDYGGAVRNGQVIEAGEYKEQQEFAQRLVDMAHALPSDRGGSEILKAGQSLQAAIEARHDPAEIKQLSARVSALAMTHFPVVLAPRATPDLVRGQALYQTHCASCHGVSGRGDGAAAMALTPKPADLMDSARLDPRSPYAIYNTLTLGVRDTSMASFAQLPDAQRWDLAYFISQWRFDAGSKQHGAAVFKAGNPGCPSLPKTLREAGQTSPAQVRDRCGKDGLDAYTFLLSQPMLLATGKGKTGKTQVDGIAFARKTLVASRDAYKAGRHADANRLALSAYLDGFELVEPQLTNRDADLMHEIERGMMGFRESVANNVPAAQVDAQAMALDGLMQRADDTLNGGAISAASNFLSSFIILAREGLEAILVLAAMFAFLRRDPNSAVTRRFVHAGWIIALLLGAATWSVSRYLIEITGASREMTEGVSALAAAAILVYVTYWLHSKGSSQDWQKFLGGKMKVAAGDQKPWLFGFLAFLAVYREVFETVLFYEALWSQGGQASILAGIAVAAVFLAVVMLLIFKLSMKLPIAAFFKWSAVMIGVLAVIFVGNGVAALQEAGRIPVHLVSVPTISLLGIHGTTQTLMAQALMIVLVLLATWLASRPRKPRIATS